MPAHEGVTSIGPINAIVTPAQAASSSHHAVVAGVCDAPAASTNQRAELLTAALALEGRHPTQATVVIAWDHSAVRADTSLATDVTVAREDGSSHMPTDTSVTLVPLGATNPDQANDIAFTARLEDIKQGVVATIV